MLIEDLADLCSLCCLMCSCCANTKAIQIHQQDQLGIQPKNPRRFVWWRARVAHDNRVRSCTSRAFDTKVPHSRFTRKTKSLAKEAAAKSRKCGWRAVIASLSSVPTFPASHCGLREATLRCKFRHPICTKLLPLLHNSSAVIRSISLCV